MENLPEILNRDQALEVLGVSRSTLFRLMRDERIAPIPNKYRRKPQLRFRKGDVEKLRDEAKTHRIYR